MARVFHAELAALCSMASSNAANKRNSLSDDLRSIGKNNPANIPSRPTCRIAFWWLTPSDLAEVWLPKSIFV